MHNRLLASVFWKRTPNPPHRSESRLSNKLPSMFPIFSSSASLWGNSPIKIHLQIFKDTLHFFQIILRLFYSRVVKSKFPIWKWITRSMESIKKYWLLACWKVNRFNDALGGGGFFFSYKFNKCNFHPFFFLFYKYFVSSFHHPSFTTLNSWNNF